MTGIRSNTKQALVRRTALLAVLSLVVLAGGWLVHQNEHGQHAIFDERFQARTGTAARFVESYVEALSSRQRQQATRLAKEIDADTFQQLVLSSGVVSGLVVDSEGTPLASYPRPPAELNRGAAWPSGLNTALAGTAAVSPVLLSNTTGQRVVHVAVPFDTSSGRRVFSMEYLVAGLPFQSFAEGEVSGYPDAVYLVDGSGTTLASARAAQALDPGALAFRILLDPALDGPGQRRLGQGDTERHAVTDAVRGTPWLLVLSAPTAVLYEADAGVGLWVPRGVLFALALAGLGSIVLIERMMAQRARILVQQDALGRNEEIFRRAFDDAFVGTIMTGIDGRLTRVNAVFADLLGYPVEKLTGTPQLDIVEPDHRVQTRLNMQEVLAGDRDGFRNVTCYLSADGAVVWVDQSTSLIRDAAGEPSYFVTSMVDVTALRAAQRERRTRDDMLRAVIANSQSPIYVKDLEGRYLLANSSFTGAALVTEDQMIGRTDAELWPEAAPRIRAHDLRAEQGEQSVEDAFEAPDGRYYETVRFPLLDPEGVLYATCGISADLTAQRRAASAMAEARDAALAAAAAKSSFLATMSHEIRTPMNAVIGMTGLLLDTALDSQQRHFVETVRTSGDALLAIINDILDFSRLEAGELVVDDRPFELRECIEESLSLLAGAAGGIDLVAEVDPSCPRVIMGDANRLRQVLINLVGNAVKFTKEGEVLVTVAPDDTAQEDGADGVRLVFDVSDTGIGIPMDRMDRLFKSFSQVDASTTRVYGGSGLGLAISKALVEAMGGQISVTSEVGVGSTFSFSLAVRACAEESVREVTPVVSADLTGSRALLVDDNETNRRVLRLQLSSWGVTCVDVSDGYAALDLLRQDARFDLAIIDMQMPLMSGAELARQIRLLPAFARLPLMLLTSLGVRPAGPDGDLFAAYHSKPVRAGVLREMLAELLPSRAPGPGLPPQPLARGSAPSAAARLRVLLAEDNAVNQEVGRLMLGALGHSVDVVSNGLEAVNALRRTAYDVVLMDIHMPIMDGLAAARAIRADVLEHAQPRIVALTASMLTEDRRACEQAGMDGYLLKPVTSALLAEALGHPAAPSAETLLPCATTEEEAPVDVDVLDSIIDQMGADPVETRRILIDSYLGQGDGWIVDLVNGASVDDAGAVRSATHALSSSSQLLGAGQLAALLTECGEAARNGGSDLRPTAAAAAREYARAATAFRAIRDADADPLPAGRR